MIFTTALLLLATTQQPALAVLSDGTRIQVTPEVAVDTFQIETPFGTFRSQGQKVVELVDSAQEVELLERLRELDYDVWVERLNERGLLERLLSETVNDQNRELLFGALSEWGAHLDPLPLDMRRDLRVQALWERIQLADSGQRALLLGTLEGEISNTGDGSKRRIGLSDWRKAMHSTDADLRWVAGRVAYVQKESAMEILLLNTSLEDPDHWIAFTSAKALVITDPRGAMHRWAYEMVVNRNEKIQRRAAYMLGELAFDYPKEAGEIAYLIISGKFGRGGGLSGGDGGSNCPNGGGSYGSGPGTAITGSGFGRSVTEGSVIEVRTPNKSKMRKVAHALERIATPTTERNRVTLDADEMPLESFEEQAEAWYQYFLQKPDA